MGVEPGAGPAQSQGVDTMGVIRRLAEAQHGVVGRRQMWAEGIANGVLHHRVEGGTLVPMSAQVLRVAGSPITEATMSMAGVLDSPGDAYLSHGSAAAWWGLPGFFLNSPVHTVIPWQGTTRRTRLAIVHYHRDLPADQLRLLNGVPVVSPALTIFLLAGAVHPGRAERALDNAWSMGLVTHRGLNDLLQRLAARGRNGIRVMRRLLAERPADYVAPQSGLEARVNRLARDVGVQLRRQIDSGDQEWIGRVDFAVEGTNRVVEVFSQRYHGSVLDRRVDERRVLRLTEAGFEVLTLWDSEVWNDADRVRDLIAAFSRGGLNPEGRVSASERWGSRAGA
ncbi:MAG TPA: DUF559 domain-containing protein [Acidimicrobiia bacterium]|nr:DUF559 domain-containing protein [Acidimicrobiia bacterium]